MSVSKAQDSRGGDSQRSPADNHLGAYVIFIPAFGGLAVEVGGLIEPRALGVGYDVIGDLLQHHLLVSAALCLLLVKSMIWVIALGSGTSGGVLAPLVMIKARNARRRPS